VVERLRVEPTELVDVPQVADVLTFKRLEVIRAWSVHLCNCEGTFPWRVELVQSFRVLNAAEDEIANVEGAFLDVAIVVESDTF
jgi:hypothetical protein